MKQELGKYYLRFAWFPTTINDNKRIWFKNYYEVHFDLPLVDTVYTISRISVPDYLIETLKGNIINGRDVNHGIDLTIERMLNAANVLPSLGARPDEELH